MPAPYLHFPLRCGIEESFPFLNVFNIKMYSTIESNILKGNVYGMHILFIIE